MAVELSVLQERLTDKAGNVAVVLDCCHAAHMVRDADLDLRVKALSREVSYEAVETISRDCNSAPICRCTAGPAPPCAS